MPLGRSWQSESLNAEEGESYRALGVFSGPRKVAWSQALGKASWLADTKSLEMAAGGTRLWQRQDDALLKTSLS
jgi:hypothetical protein